MKAKARNERAFEARAREQQGRNAEAGNGARVSASEPRETGGERMSVSAGDGEREEFQQAAERDEAIRRELRQEIEALRGEIQRLERWFLAFAIPVLLMLAGIIVQNFLK
jgi:hypothetical protein